MNDKPNVCRHCRKPIPEGADICFRCKRSQGFFSAKLESVTAFISVVSMILSLALVTLSWLQFHEAIKQRNSADKAVQSASDALRQATAAAGDALKAKSEAKIAKDEAERARDETQNTVDNLRGNIKLLLEKEYLTPTLVDESHYDPEKVRRVLQKLEEFAVPNENERKKWLKSFK